MVRYYSDYGTFNDFVNDRHIDLSEENKAEVNAVLEKYFFTGGGNEGQRDH